MTDPLPGEVMRAESWIREAPPDASADVFPSEHDAVLESERLESLISGLRRAARRQGQPASRSDLAVETARSRALRELSAEGADRR